MNKAPLFGLVLCGGKSLRMGEDKSRLVYHQKQQWEETAQLLQPWCERIYFSVSASAGLPEGMNPNQVIVDAVAIPESPLRGIVSALKTDQSAAWITMPIDMPLMTGEVLQNLVSHRDDTQLATCFQIKTRIEPLVTIWEPDAYPAMMSFIQQGGFSPRKFLETHAVRVIVCHDADWTLNINTPEERDRFLTNGNKPYSH